ncbi:MAG: type II secretion system protein [Pirellulaceae bacterium]
MRRQSTPQQVRSQYGFTLLELLLVVFILSVLAVSAVSLTDNLDTAQDQYRVEATKNQGSAFEKGIINISADGRSISGFVTDMGALPSNMMELAYGVRDLATPLRFPAYQMVSPVFDPTPTLGFNDGSADSISILSFALGKGFRGQQTTNGVTEFFHGSYINLGIGSTTDYKSDGAALLQDGWGNGSISDFYTIDGSNQSPINSGHTLTDLTHGWQLASISDATYTGENFFGDTPAANGIGALTLSTSGQDGATGGDSPYEVDQVIARLQPDDWSIVADDVRVEVFNDLPAGNVFNNQYNVNEGLVDDPNTDGGNEYTYGIVLLACNSRSTDNPLDGTATGWQWAQFPSANIHVHIPTNSSRIFTLTNRINGPLRIPAGEHLLLLVRCNAAGVPQSGINFPSVYVRTIQDGNTANKKNEIQQIRLIDSAVSAVGGLNNNGVPSNFRIWVDRDGNGEHSLIPTGTIDLASANDIAQPAIYQALTMDNGPKTIIQPGQDNCIVTRVATNIWNIEFQMGGGDGDDSTNLYTDMDPMQIDYSGLNFSAARFHATPVQIRPGSTTTLRLNLSAFTP